MTLTAKVDGCEFALIGMQQAEKAALTGREVLPTKTVYTFEAKGAQIRVLI